MENVFTLPPRTLLEVFESLPEGTLAQLINNQIYMSPAPNVKHQILLAEIFNSLFNYVKSKKLGTVLTSPFDVFLNQKNVYQPDIIFISNQNMEGLKDDGFHGAPDLIIEILSPASIKFDKGFKKDEYEKSGVAEYWIVDPVTKVAEGFYLEDKSYKAIPPAEGIISSKLIGFTLRF